MTDDIASEGKQIGYYAAAHRVRDRIDRSR